MKTNRGASRECAVQSHVGELRVPREASGLGRRQLNELLVNTPYFRRHPEFIPSSSWTSGLARAGTRGSPRG